MRIVSRSTPHAVLLVMAGAVGLLPVGCGDAARAPRETSSADVHSQSRSPSVSSGVEAEPAAVPAAAAPTREASEPETEPAVSGVPRPEGGVASDVASRAAPNRTIEVVVPAGTPLSLRLTTAVSSDVSRVEDPVRAVLTKPVVIDDVTAIPEGAELTGSILEARQSGRVKGRATVSFSFDRVSVRGTRYDLRTVRTTRVAQATKGEDAKKIGIGAGAGAVLGAVTGGKKGTAIGAAVGAGGGTGVVMATRGREVQLAAGTLVVTKLAAPVTVRMADRL